VKTIVGLFDDYSQAQKAASDLESAGIPRDDISIVANNEGGKYAPTDTTAASATPSVSGHAIGHDAIIGAEVGGAAGLLLGLTGLAIPGLGWIASAGWLMGALLGAGTGAIVGGLVGALTHVGVPHEDAAHYTEGVRRGGTLVAVKAQDEVAYRVAQILGDDGAVDIDERAGQYKQEGYVPPVASQTVAATTPTNASALATNLQDQATVPVIEEQLKVGKREVEGGGIRVYTHVTETPVQEQVTLRQEHVTVDRQPVNRVASAADVTAAFQEGTIDVTARSEEAVVSKEARVVEEVTIGKRATDRTETISDTVRRTDVDVEELDRDDDTVYTTTGTKQAV